MLIIGCDYHPSFQQIAFVDTESGELGERRQAARRYCEDCLVYTPDDPLVLYKLADCLARLGQPDEARKRAVEGRKAAVSRNDEIGRSAVTLIEQRFPELKGGP